MTQAPRLAGLDLFRGLAVAGMILVNTPGSWNYVWWPLDHAPWHGFTPTDLVFPAFLFAVGTALALSFPRRIDAKVWTRIVRRSLSLVAIGWAFQFVVRPELATFRVFGVLPRIGLCYALGAGFAILTARRDADGRAHLRPLVILGTAAGLLLLYAALLLCVPVPGHGAGDLSPEGNLAGWVDRMTVGTAHMWHQGTDAAGNVVYDPEGLLSTLGALANVLFGMLAAIVWRRAPGRAVVWIALGGVLLAAIGLALTPVLPLNKRLWTSSFALYTSGLSALILALCMVASSRAALRPFLAPFRVFGMNAILGYVLSLILGIAGFKLFVHGTALQDLCFEWLHGVVGDPYVASFTYAVAVVLIVLAALIPLHRRGIHLRL